MKKLILMLGLAALLTSLSGCAEFNESFENIVEDKKIRPMAIRLTPAEAMPGDTVQVDLFLWDAGKDYSLEFKYGKGYSINDYGEGAKVDTLISLDDSAFDIARDGLQFKFVVPNGVANGEENPLLISPMLGETLEGPDGEISKSELIELLETMDTIPAEFQAAVDGFTAPILIQAQVRSGDFELDIDKLLTIRYSRKLAPVEVSNVNTNPRLDSLAIIAVDAEIEDPEEIANHSSDTVWIPLYQDSLVAAYTTESEEYHRIDTIEIDRSKSYFTLLGISKPQRYLSPMQKEHSELYFTSWFYTNLSDVKGDDYDNGLGFSFYDENSMGQLGKIKLPKTDEEFFDFLLHLTLVDERPEWSVLNTRGVAVGQLRGTLKFLP